MHADVRPVVLEAQVVRDLQRQTGDLGHGPTRRWALGAGVLLLLLEDELLEAGQGGVDGAVRGGLAAGAAHGRGGMDVALVFRPASVASPMRKVGCVCRVRCVYLIAHLPRVPSRVGCCIFATSSRHAYTATLLYFPIVLPALAIVSGPCEKNNSGAIGDADPASCLHGIPHISLSDWTRTAPLVQNSTCYRLLGTNRYHRVSHVPYAVTEDERYPNAPTAPSLIDQIGMQCINAKTVTMP